MEHRKGIWLAIGAYFVWGIGPIFWNTLSSVSAIEVLSHRIVWSVPLLFAIIAGRRRLGIIRESFQTPRTVVTAVVGGVLLSVNWGLFVWAVTTEHIVDASLGYFINPLVSVALGVIVLRERLTAAQRVAVGIAAIGVAEIAIVSGVVPWISLVLALSFGAYGLLKKRPATAPPFEGLFMETAVVATPALVYLAGLAGAGEGAFGSTQTLTVLAVAAGAFTVTPLVLFAAAAQRIPLSMLGILQYVTPTMHLFIGVLVFDEVVASGEWVGFALVWIALVIYTIANARIGRADRTTIS